MARVGKTQEGLPSENGDAQMCKTLGVREGPDILLFQATGSGALVQSGWLSLEQVFCIFQSLLIHLQREKGQQPIFCGSPAERCKHSQHGLSPQGRSNGVCGRVGNLSIAFSCCTG